MTDSTERIKELERIAAKYNPPIFRSNGVLDSDYHYRQTILAVRAATEAALESAATMAEGSFDDGIEREAGRFIASEIRALKPSADK